MSFFSRLTVAGRQHEHEQAENIIHEVDAENNLPPIDEKQPLITLPVVACGAGLFSDGYINNVSFPRAWTEQKLFLKVSI